jgi:hypothetical protein
MMLLLFGGRLPFRRSGALVCCFGDAVLSEREPVETDNEKRHVAAGPARVNLRIIRPKAYRNEKGRGAL